MKINFNIRGCELWIKEAEGEDKWASIKLDWQDIRRLSAMLLALIEIADKHNIVEGVLNK